VFQFVCALCDSPENLWYEMTKDGPDALPLRVGDLVCKSCSEGLPKSTQDLLHWVNRHKRQEYLDSLKK
jgi:hypothetical protein